MKEKFSYASTPTLVPIIPEIERFGYDIAFAPVSFTPIEGED